MRRHNLAIENSRNFSKKAKRISQLEKDKEKVLIAKAKKGKKPARDELILSHLWLVVVLAKRFFPFVESDSGLTIFDLIQEGILGIYRAIEKFDLSSGNRFSTYAKFWIGAYMGNAIIDQKIIRVPKKTNTDLQKLRKVARKLRVLGKDFELEEVALAIGISKGGFKNVLKTPKIISLNTPLRRNRGRGTRTLEGVIPSDEPTPEQEAAELEKKELVKKAFGILNKRERKILKMNFGIEEREKTLKEIGKYFGFSHQRAGQIKKEALKKLKKSKELKALQQ